MPDLPGHLFLCNPDSGPQERPIKDLPAPFNTVISCPNRSEYNKISVAAILRDSQNRVLVVQRPAKGLLGSLWKFPGGFLHKGEALPACLRRTVKEELGLEIQVHDLISSVKHAYTHFRMTLYIFHCTHNGGEPFAPACQNRQWATPGGFEKLPFSRADRKVIAAISHGHTLCVHLKEGC